MQQHLQLGGLSISMYDLFNNIAAVTLLLYVFAQIKSFMEICPYAQKSKHPFMIGIIVITAIGVPFFALFRVLNTFFGKWFTAGNANYYGNLTAWLITLTIIPLILKISPLKTLDLFTPGLPLCLFPTKLACFFHGCCSGFELPGSFYYNLNTDRYEFPTQFVEALVALAFFFILRRYQKVNKIPGSVFPIYLTIYSISRFLTEFLRADFPNVMGPLDAYQVMSIVFMLLGGFLFYIVWLYQEEKEHRQTKR